MRKIIFIVLFILPLFVFAEEKPLTLEESISIALEKNASVKLASEKIKEATAGKNQALSNLFPKIGTSSSYTRLDEKTTMSIPSMPSVVVSSDEIYDYNLNLTQPIFHGGILPAYQLQRENLKASQNNFEAVQNDLIMEVKRAYFQVLETGKIKQVSEEAIIRVKSHLTVVEAYFKEGLASEVEVLRVKVALANARQDLVSADNGLSLAKSRFNSLLNRDLGQEVNLEDILNFEDYNVELSTSIDQALISRPEIRQMQNNLRVSEAGISIARSFLLPQVSLIGNWDRKKGAEIPVNEWDDGWTAVISVEMDIWDWGENLNGVRKANAQLEQMKSNFALLQDNVELEVRQSYLNLIAAREKISLQDEAVKEADKNFRDTSLRFKEGMSTNTDVLDAQTLFSQARTNYYQALYEYNIAAAELERATGGGNLNEVNYEEK